MIPPDHPDVQISEWYPSGGERRFCLNIITILTPHFPYGLPLYGDFDDHHVAETHAVRVQQFLDAMKEPKP